MLEYFGVVTGLLYLFLEIRQHQWMWIVGFITSLIYVFVFFSAKIYADMGLNVYYVLISIYGFIEWGRKGKRVPQEKEEEEAIVYRRATPALLAGATAAIVVLWAVIWYILAHFTDSPIPAGDALTTAAGIVATWMLARRIIEHWLFWIGVNFLSMYLYFLRGLYPTMFLYLCYAVLAIVGLYTWKKKGLKAEW